MIFILTWIIWCASEIFVNVLIRSGSTDKEGQDKGSLKYIWIIIALAITSGVLIANYVDFPISNNQLIPYIGLAMVVVGMILRFISIWTLGRLFTVDVTIRDDHKIKKDGAYKILRHPSYASSLLSFIGFGVSLNNWLSVISVTILVIFALSYRIKVEEKTLVEHFGSDYSDYMKKTYRLIPWIY
jgi:protein-S-isoprenylcysteine O-methyltransferase Ste14